MTRHITDADLLRSGGPGGQLTRLQQHHLRRCAACQERRNMLAALMPEPPSPPPAPSWDSVKPSVQSANPAFMNPWTRVGAALLVLIVAVGGWSRIIWPRAPWGVEALQILAAGHSVPLQKANRSVHGSVAIVANRQTGWVLLTCREVKPLSPHQVYEAWWIQGHQHIKAGVFRVNSHGQAWLWLHTDVNVARAQALGITVESAPGSPVPTGPHTFFGKLSS